MSADLSWAVAVFAHNEELHIAACLRSIVDTGAGQSIRIHVLANGCQDRTEAVVQDFALSHPCVTLASLALSDKAGAWNSFVHDLAPEAQVCFFVDGDVQVTKGSFDALAASLQMTPEANAAAAVPATGRSRKSLEDLVCRDHCLLGGLYALRGNFVRRAREAGARLPVGFIGDDGLVTSLVKWDLDPSGPHDRARVVPCLEARFGHRGLSAWNPLHWRPYCRRQVRYSVRHFQHRLLVPLLVRGGLAAMPATVAELYERQIEALHQCRPRLGPDFFFDVIALRQMRAGR